MKRTSFYGFFRFYIQRFSFFRFVVIVCTCLPSALFAKDILTTTPITYMLATQLMKGTEVTTTYLAPKRYGIERLNNWFATKGQLKASQAGKEAKVAITLKALWPQDPLFIYARQGNIELIEIDASQSITPRAKGIATVKMQNGHSSLYAWLNPNNLGSMLGIVADDLKRVWPAQAELITQNQHKLMVSIRLLINQQQTRLFDQEIDSVVLLSDQLEDFASANQLFVMQRLFKAELEWTEQDKSELQSLLKDSPELWILTTKKVSEQLKAIVSEQQMSEQNVSGQKMPEPKILVIDSLDRWGSKGIDLDNPLQRWLF